MLLSKIRNRFLFCSTLFILAACGGGGSSDGTGTLDTTPPVITLNGNNPLSLTQNTTYVEAGATATDDVDSSVSVIISGTVDTSTVGTYTITYTATDTATNTATSTRTVNVTYNQPPLVSAGDDQVEFYNSSVTLSAAASDPDGTIVSHLWEIGDTELSTEASFSSTDFPMGSSDITLTATDNNGASASDTLTITITLPAPQNIIVDRVTVANLVDPVSAPSWAVAWDEVPYADSYTVYRATASGVTPENVLSLADGQIHTNLQSPARDLGMTALDNFHIVVVAVKDGIEGALSSEVEADEFAPYYTVVPVTPERNWIENTCMRLPTVGFNGSANACNLSGGPTSLVDVLPNIAIPQDPYHSLYTYDTKSHTTDAGIWEGEARSCGACLEISSEYGSIIGIVAGIADINSVGANGSGVGPLHIDTSALDAIGIGYAISSRSLVDT